MLTHGEDACTCGKQFLLRGRSSRMRSRTALSGDRRSRTTSRVRLTSDTLSLAERSRPHPHVYSLLSGRDLLGNA